MSERLQVILKLLGLFVVTGLLGVGLYFLFFGGNGPSIKPPDNVDEPEPIGGLPTAGVGVPNSGNNGGTTSPGSGTGTLPVSPVANGGVTQTTILTTSAIKTPTVISNGTVAYYDPADGKFYTIDEDGNVILLSQAAFPQAETVVFANDATAAVVEFPDGSNVVYDFENGKQTTLPAHWEEFSFSEDGENIATKSLGNDPSNRSLVITAVDGSSTTVIAALGANDDEVEVNWSPTGDVVGFSKTGGAGSAFGQNEIYLIGPDGEASGVLIVNGSNFQNIWSPDGANLLYSIADAGDDYRASLWYGDSEGDRRGDTRLRLSLKTTVDKCTFASSTLAYCAVPNDMPPGGGSTSSLVTAPDSLYSIALPSGRTTLVAVPDRDTKMSNLSVSADGKELYYTDAVGRLNLIQLD